MKLRKYIQRILATGIALAIALLGPARAQEPVLSLKAPGTVTAGQAFDVQYAINVRGSKNFQAPAFKGLDVLYGPAQSQSSSFSFVNGHQTQSFTLSFTYRLSAPQPGTYTFGKASITVDGKTYYSEPFTLTVTAASPGGNSHNSGSYGYGSATSAYATSATASSSGADPAQNQPQKSQATIGDGDLYIRALPSKRNPYVGEQILLTYRIYTSLPVEQYSIYKTPSNKGCWTEELKVDPNSQQQEIINNKSYVWADIRKVALFAQESGKLQLDPMEVEAVAEVRSPSRRRSRSIFDLFEDDFFSPTQLVKKTLTTQALQLNVKPLPLEGRPQSFDGLVGDYSIDFDYNKAQSFKTNEAITFTFIVSGNGNVEMIHAPQIQFPPDFEVYEPKISHIKNVSSNGISGSAIFEYIVVPRNPGAYKIPAFHYCFFNPATAKYTEKHIEEIVLNIEPGKDMPSPGSVQGNRGGGTPGGDIAYIQTGMAGWKKTGRNFLFSLWFWLGLLAELAVFSAVLLVMKRSDERKADVAGMKNRKAAKEAKRCLKKAQKFLTEGKRDEFHIEISQALWGFLGDKLNIPTAELSMDNIRGKLVERALEAALIEQFIKALESCEFARFAPGEPDGADMKRLYDEALEAVYLMAARVR